MIIVVSILDNVNITIPSRNRNKLLNAKQFLYFVMYFIKVNKTILFLSITTACNVYQLYFLASTRFKYLIRINK